MTNVPRRLTAALLEAGWVLVRATKHQIWRCPCGQHQVVFPRTPSDRRGPRNTLADIRRTGCPYQPHLERTG